jgi:hypothetical protein
VTEPSLAGGITVVLALKPLLADLVESILATDDSIRVAGRIDAGAEPDLARTLAVARSSCAQVVVLGVDGHSRSRISNALFDARPRLKVVSIDDDGRGASTCELVPHSTPLGELRPESLLAAIRDVAVHTWEASPS